MADPVEVELKFRVTDGPALERLLDADWVGEHAAGAWRTFELEDRYLDTSDGALARGGYGARLRRQDGAITLTLKSLGRGEGPGGALFRRVELEGPATWDVHPESWPASEARRRLMALAGDAPLVPRFTLRQVRRERDLRGSDGWAVLSLDAVRVEAAGHDIGGGNFVEVESRGGSERMLQEVGAILESSGAVTPEGRSKEALATELLNAARQPGSVRPWGPHRDDAEPATRGPTDTAPPAAEPVARPALAPVEPLVPEDPPTAPTVAEADAEEPLPAADGPEPEPEPGPEAKVKAADRPAPASEPTARAAAPEPQVAPEPKSTPRRRTRAATARPAAKRPRRPRAAVVEGAEPDERGQIIDRLRTGRTPGVVAGDSLAEAGRKVLRFHFARMLEREAGTRLGDDLEELHSMRVATRRMRAAWRVFGDGFRHGPSRRYVSELRTVATALGSVRDQDVLLDGLTAYMGSLPPEEGVALAPLHEAWQAVRNEAREHLVKLLDGDGYQRFVEDYVAFVETSGAGGRVMRATDPHRVRDTAPSRVWAAYEQLRAYDSTLTWADVPTLHVLRIAGKRLRYTLEFFREVLGADATTLIARVTALQDHLGLLHDADVAAHLAREFLASSAAGLSAETIQAVGRYLASREKEVARLRRTMPAVWRPLVGDAFRRALGRAVSVI
ncbi:MAG: CHAD domain-containing protein [Candidatus Limnocylindrales bacterium]